MTEVIKLEQAGLEHMLKQPASKRYALFCVEGFRQRDIMCDSRDTGGHIDDFRDYGSARTVGVGHPHSVIIRFYPDWDDHQEPSADFVTDFRQQKPI